MFVDFKPTNMGKILDTQEIIEVATTVNFVENAIIGYYSIDSNYNKLPILDFEHPNTQEFIVATANKYTSGDKVFYRTANFIFRIKTK